VILTSRPFTRLTGGGADDGVPCRRERRAGLADKPGPVSLSTPAGAPGCPKPPDVATSPTGGAREKLGVNPLAVLADGDSMSELPTLDELLRRKAIETDGFERSRLRAEAARRDLEAAHDQYWVLLEEFAERVRELAVPPQMWTPDDGDGYTPRIMWIEGFPLVNGSVLTPPPLRYCSAERRKVRRPQATILPVDELTLFVPLAETRAGRKNGVLERHTPSTGTWPRIQRLEHASTILSSLQRRLEMSLLTLID
jgi:hypothetical protein